ncbi:uncharacterized protein FTOL_13336 [Fusarium torulosum]|uniref:Uncharacterized protein n=1 Tax=Fusarium torulosum TaxID=33205 RepID=A0AAE8SPR0_9HYPO|nr:uncharacterized protein FTOL_13336 [Fusarium torulosum]
MSTVIQIAREESESRTLLLLVAIDEYWVFDKLEAVALWLLNGDSYLIILGGDREILRDVLNYKREAATKKADQTGSNYKTNTLTGRDGIASSSPPPPEEEFQFI